LSQLVSQDFHGDGAVVCMLCAENGGSSAFTHFALQRVSRNRLTD